MNPLKTALQSKSNVSHTHNGALTNASSLNACVDLFSQIGAMRARSDQEVIDLFAAAFAEDKNVALKILFWARDIRGGAGERKVFRTILKYLGEVYPKDLEGVVHLVPRYARWDDLFVLEGANVELWRKIVVSLKEKLEKDLTEEKPSLLAKWMKSENTSSSESRRLAKQFIKMFGWSSKKYRKTLSTLRKKIRIVESQMCSDKWGEIDYETVPSKASLLYRKAFQKHDEERYQDYLSQVASGEKTIKTAALYPYDLIRKVYGWLDTLRFDQTVSLQWENLPNYVEPFNGIVLVDSSGSMTNSGYYGGTRDSVRPIDVALSLAVYTAERNEGVWKNCFIPFSNNARFQEIKGGNIFEKLRSMRLDGFFGSTNLQSAFDLILSTAIENNVSQEDMPKKLFIVSDVEFDGAVEGETNFQTIEKKFEAAGYRRPDIIFWNVNAYGGNSPVKYDQNGTAMVSGASPAIFKTVLTGDTPYDVMIKTVTNERYVAVEV